MKSNILKVLSILSVSLSAFSANWVNPSTQKPNINVSIQTRSGVLNGKLGFIEFEQTNYQHLTLYSPVVIDGGSIFTISFKSQDTLKLSLGRKVCDFYNMKLDESSVLRVSSGGLMRTAGHVRLTGLKGNDFSSALVVNSSSDSLSVISCAE